MSEFKQKVIEVVQNVPFGTVVSYGQVAVMIGVPRAARQVGWILNSTEGKFALISSNSCVLFCIKLILGGFEVFF